MDTYINGAPRSYQRIVNERRWWLDSDDLDQPGHLYFKIFFHFLDDNPMGNGLLHPSWKYSSGEWVTQSNYSHRAKELDYWQHSSAWSYLKQNGEEERAAYLKQFVELLSNISTYSPWYFQSISGLGEALQRNTTEVKEEERKKITIGFLEDSTDERIGTLLDLYRMSCWSHLHRREMLPVNLRRFDMTVVFFSSPIWGLHEDVGLWSNFDLNSAGKISSFKAFEFLDCELEYNSTNSGYGEVSNATGFNPQYSLDITFNNVVELRHNEFLVSLNTIQDATTNDLGGWHWDGGDGSPISYGNIARR